MGGETPCVLVTTNGTEALCLHLRIFVSRVDKFKCGTPLTPCWVCSVCSWGFFYVSLHSGGCGCAGLDENHHFCQEKAFSHEETTQRFSLFCQTTSACLFVCAHFTTQAATCGWSVFGPTCTALRTQKQTLGGVLLVLLLGLAPLQVRVSVGVGQYGCGSSHAEQPWRECARGGFSSCLFALDSLMSHLKKLQSHCSVRVSFFNNLAVKKWGQLDFLHMKCGSSNRTHGVSSGSIFILCFIDAAFVFIIDKKYHQYTCISYLLSPFTRGLANLVSSWYQTYRQLSWSHVYHYTSIFVRTFIDIQPLTLTLTIITNLLTLILT